MDCAKFDITNEEESWIGEVPPYYICHHDECHDNHVITSLSPLHNAQIEQFGGAVYQIQPYMIPRNILLLRINRVWDSGAHFEPNSMNTES